MNSRKGSPNIKIVSENRVRLAMQILHNFQNTWPIAIWTRHLLDSLLKIPSGQTDPDHDPRGFDVAVLSQNNESAPFDHEPELEGFPAAEQCFLGLETITDIPPPQSASEADLQHYDFLSDSRQPPIFFPFANIFEDVDSVMKHTRGLLLRVEATAICQ